MKKDLHDSTTESIKTKIIIRNATENDIERIVEVHLKSFEGFFLSFLGARFLSLLYREVLKEPGNIFLVSISRGGEINGFVVGVKNQAGMYKRMALKKWFAFAIASTSKALLHPSIIPRLFRALKQSSKAEIAICPGLLMSIAVSPNVKGQGIGKMLVNEFLTEMSNQGVERISLTTDRDNNDSTNIFYVKLNFSLVRQFQTHEGRWMNEFLTETKRVQK